MGGMIATGLQVVGLALIVLAGFLIFVPLGFVLAGVACILFGLTLEL